jgi:NAD dependent epimerase/dehydratase family enzyme
MKSSTLIYYEDKSQYMCNALVNQLRHDGNEDLIITCSNENNNKSSSTNTMHLQWTTDLFEQHEDTFSQYPLRTCFYLNDHCDLRVSKWTRENVTLFYNNRIEVLKILLQYCELSSTSIVFIATSSVLQPLVKKSDDDSRVGRLFDSMEKCIALNGMLDDEEGYELTNNLTKKVVIRSAVHIVAPETIGSSLLPYASNMVFCPGTGTQYFSFIHVNDLAKLLSFAATSEGLLHHAESSNGFIILNGTSLNYATYEDYYQSIASSLKKHSSLSPKLIHIPTSVVKYMSGYDRYMILTHEHQSQDSNVIDPTRYGFSFGELQKVNLAVEDCVKQFSVKKEFTTFLWRQFKRLLTTIFILIFIHYFFKIYFM